MKFLKLQKNNLKNQKFKKYKRYTLILKSFAYLEITYFKIINCYYNNILVGFYEIQKTWELIIKKYF